MSESIKIRLFVSNHGKKAGIEDYINSFEYLFRKRGFDFAVSEKLHDDALNLLIDEFTNHAVNAYIAKFTKSARNAKLVLVLTEFIEKQFLVTSLNNFEGMGEAATLAFANCFLRHMRDDFRKPRMSDYFIAVLYAPVMIWVLGKLSAEYIYRVPRGGKAAKRELKRRYLYRHLYMHSRYLGLESMLGHMDAVVLAHQGIQRGYVEMCRAIDNMPECLGVFYQEFSTDGLDGMMLVNKRAAIEMTGSITRFRRSEKVRINRQIALLGLSHWLGQVSSRGFKEGRSEEGQAAFSIHPPQQKNWPYCSPTRIYRALVVDHNIPILTKRYGQHPIEDLCLTSLDEAYEMMADRENLERFLSERIGRYLGNVSVMNDDLCRGLKRVSLSKARSG